MTDTDMTETWQCCRCTLENAPGAGRCEACGAGRGAEPSESVSSELDDSDVDDGLDEPEEAAHTVAIHVAKRLWCAALDGGGDGGGGGPPSSHSASREETELRRVEARDAAAARNGGAIVSFDDKRAAKAQIFTSQARAPTGLLGLALTIP
jgi:hypothetical protein